MKAQHKNMKSATSTITINGGDCSRESPALVIGYFAICPKQFKHESATYNLVHVPTGLSFCHTRTIRDAKSAISECMALPYAERWQIADARELFIGKGANKDFANRARDIRRRYEATALIK